MSKILIWSILITILSTKYSIQGISAGQEMIKTLQGHKAGVISVTFSPDGNMLASGGLDKTVIIWDYTSGKVIRTLFGHKSFVGCLVFSRDGKKLAAGGGQDHTIRVWNVEDGELITTFEKHSEDTYAFVWGPENKTIISAGDDGGLRVWDAISGKQLFHLKGHKATVLALALSGDEKILASGDECGAIIFWDVLHWNQLKKIEAHSEALTSLSFLKEKKRLISGSGLEKKIRIWDVDREKEISAIDVGRIGRAAVFPNGQKLATAEYLNGIINIWDLQSRRCVRTFKAHNEPVPGLAFSPDGKKIATASHDKTIKIWNISE